MKTIKVKAVRGPQGECAIAGPYYRERHGAPLLCRQGAEWVVCSPDGEPQASVDANQYEVEVVG